MKKDSRPLSACKFPVKSGGWNFSTGGARAAAALQDFLNRPPLLHALDPLDQVGQRGVGQHSHTRQAHESGDQRRVDEREVTGEIRLITELALQAAQQMLQLLPRACDQLLIASARQELKHLLGRLERELGDQPYLAGDFSLVDAALIPRFVRLAGMGVLPDPSLPN